MILLECWINVWSTWKAPFRPFSHAVRPPLQKYPIGYSMGKFYWIFYGIFYWKLGQILLDFSTIFYWILIRYSIEYSIGYAIQYSIGFL